MNNRRRNGFTLIELLAVIIILSLLALIAGTSITKLLKDSKEDLYNDQMVLIKSAAESWGANNILKLPEAGECKYLTLKNLKEAGLMDPKVIDPRTNEEISDDLKIKITGTLSKHKKLVLNYEVNPESIDGCVPMFLNPKGTYLMTDTKNNNSADTTFLGGTTNRSTVETITIKNTKTVPSNAITSWDVSEAKDGSVIAWYTDTDNNNLYELYIGGEGGVKANPKSSYLFRNFNNVKIIDLEFLDTSQVTNIALMFQNCGNLTNINFGSNFDTSNVTSMIGTFQNCKNLINLNLSKFDISKVKTEQAMLNGCSKLKTVTVKDTDAKTFIEARLADENMTGVTVTIAA